MIYEMKRLFKNTGGGAKFLFLLTLRCPFNAVMTVIQAIFLQQAFNAVSQNNVNKLSTICLCFGVASLCLFLYNGTIWSVYSHFVVHMEGVLRTKLFNKISKFSYERIEADSHGEWFTRLNTDVQMPFSQPLHFPHAACSIVNICICSIILWNVSPSVFGLVLLFVVPHIVISHFLVLRAMPFLNKKSLEAKAKNTADLTALVTCAGVAALYNGQDYIMERFKQSSLEYFRTNMKIHTRKAINSALVPLFGLGGYMMLLVVIYNQTANIAYTIGGMTAAFQYRGGILSGSMMLINSLISIQLSMAGIRRLNDTMDEKTEEADG